MSDDTSVTDVVDPSGNVGTTEHPPIHADEGARRMLISSVWGSSPAYVSSENGADVTPWNPDCSWYQYGKQYGLNGCQHPGMDIGLEFGTDLFAAERGQIVYAGPDRYYEPIHVNILTSAGEVHIYGHMSEVDPSISLGGQVQAGQRLGKSGTSNGPHLHFERRVPDSSCPSGYAVLDPESTLVSGSVPPTAFAAGDRIEVVNGPLHFRDGASLNASILEDLPTGAELAVVRGPEQSDGYAWYEATKVGDNKQGWLAGQFCRLSTSQGTAR